jgi:tellurite resistance protein TerC
MSLAELTPWIVFFAAVTAALTIDLVAGSRRDGVMSTRQAFAWSAGWIALGLAFAGAVWGWRGDVAAQQYLAGYLIEKSLSVDNLFVFLIVFGTLGIELQHQRKVLFWGILGAIVMRGVFIFAGVALIERLHWVIYVFGAVLIYTAYRMIRSHGVKADPEHNPLVRAVRRVLPFDAGYRGHDFLTRSGGALMITPLALALVAVESADVVFAVDSVPAVLAISTDTFVVFTSNIAAILGLRALYFALAGTLQRFEYLSWGLAAVLAFVGVKMLLSDVLHVPIGSSMLVSWWLTRGAEPDAVVLVAAGHASAADGVTTAAALPEAPSRAHDERALREPSDG